ncbi:secretion protein HlyD [Bryobacterales bacterium F-183]|nr:secretion protein HlyD [Bryobacterales bacterium F-183]
MKRILPILLIAAIAGAAIYYFRTRNTVPENEIHLSGNIEMTQIAVAFKYPGRVMAIEVEEGATVKKGQILARSDRESTTRQKERDQAAVASAQSAYEQLTTAVAWQKQAVEREIELRTAELRAVEAQLSEALAGSRPQEVQQAEAFLSDARTQNAQAKADWDRAQKLFAQEDISRAQYDQFKTRFDSTSALVRQAEMRLSIVKEGPRKENIALIRAQVARAQAALKSAENNRLEVKRRELEAQGRLSEVERAKAQVAVLDVQLNDTTAKSPVDGVVLNKNADLGEVLNAGVPVLTVGDTAKPWVRGYITEAQLGKVKLGDKVKVTTDSYPGKTYQGRVTFIASEAEFTPKQIQTQEERIKLVYRVKIELDNPNNELKLNMPVDAVITL